MLNKCETPVYDDMNRLSSITVNSGTTQNFTFTYDRYGNRLTQTLTAGSTAPQPQFSFSSTTNQISSYTYDAAGNVINDGSHTYTYDAEGNLITVDGGSTAQYTYDALNHRVRSQTTAANYEYLYNPAGQRTSSWLNPSSTSPGTGNEGRIYWGGQQIAFRAANGTTYFEHQDYLGTERMRTDYTGAVAAKYTSLAWGDGSSASIGGTSVNQDNAIFAGLDFDSENGSHHALFRNYASSQGRWLSPDPYAGSYDFTNPQSFNRYAYALNNPLSLTDPSGLLDCKYPPCDPNNGNPPVFTLPPIDVWGFPNYRPASRESQLR